MINGISQGAEAYLLYRCDACGTEAALGPYVGARKERTPPESLACIVCGEGNGRLQYVRELSPGEFREWEGSSHKDALMSSADGDGQC